MRYKKILRDGKWVVLEEYYGSIVDPDAGDPTTAQKIADKRNAALIKERLDV